MINIAPSTFTPILSVAFGDSSGYYVEGFGGFDLRSGTMPLTPLSIDDTSESVGFNGIDSSVWTEPVNGMTMLDNPYILAITGTPDFLRIYSSFSGLPLVDLSIGEVESGAPVIVDYTPGFCTITGLKIALPITGMPSVNIELANHFLKLITKGGEVPTYFMATSKITSPTYLPDSVVSISVYSGALPESPLVDPAGTLLWTMESDRETLLSVDNNTLSLSGNSLTAVAVGSGVPSFFRIVKVSSNEDIPKCIIQGLIGSTSEYGAIIFPSVLTQNETASISSITIKFIPSQI